MIGFSFQTIVFRKVRSFEAKIWGPDFAIQGKILIVNLEQLLRYKMFDIRLNTNVALQNDFSALLRHSSNFIDIPSTSFLQLLQWLCFRVAIN